MHHRTVLSLAISLVFTASPSAADKKLIEFGWDEPDTSFMRAHVDEMERTPFDGCVFHITYAKAGETGAGTGAFVWECWSRRAFTEKELQPALEDLKATKFRRFTENFLRFNTAPGDVDWFDDFSAIVSNARLAARVAREGKARGLLFDIEQYNSPLFDYHKQRDAKGKSWDEYAGQVRRRGREVMAAFQEGYPGLSVFLTFGYSLPYAQTGGDPAKLPEAHYGLLAPFLDGLLDAAEGGTLIIDGYELSYGYKELAQFTKARRTMTQGVLPFVHADHDKYPKHVSAAFGLWMDEDWRKKGWNTDDLSKNYFSPEAFESAARHSLETTDKYVWIYTEQPRWWTAGGSPEKLPPAYERALRSAAGR